MKRKLVILVEVLLVAVAVIGAVFIFRHPDRHDDKTANASTTQADTSAKNSEACQRFTLAEAKQLLGNQAKAGSNPVPDSNDQDLNVSSCTYTQQNLPDQQPPQKHQAATLLMRRPLSSKATQTNQAEFGPLKPTDVQDVSGLGDKAYWDPEHGQLNILKGDIWYVLSIGTSTPAERSLDQTRTMADLLLPKL